MDSNQVSKTAEQQKVDALPDGVRGWNWGAFLISLLWAIGNRVWSMVALLAGVLLANYVFLSLVPESLVGAVNVIFFVVIFALNILLGLKGNEWAWHDRKWDSVQQFRKSQKNWTIAGLAVNAIGVLLLLAVFQFGLVKMA